jgi:hypothetical protein
MRFFWPILRPEQWIRPWWLAVITYVSILTATVALWPILLPGHGWLFILSLVCNLILGTWCGRGVALAYAIHLQEQYARENDFYDGL